jgi:hypothetical protein
MLITFVFAILSGKAEAMSTVKGIFPRPGCNARPVAIRGATMNAHRPRTNLEVRKDKLIRRFEFMRKALAKPMPHDLRFQNRRRNRPRPDLANSAACFIVEAFSLGLKKGSVKGREFIRVVVFERLVR